MQWFDQRRSWYTCGVRATLKTIPIELPTQRERKRRAGVQERHHLLGWKRNGMDEVVSKSILAVC